MPRANRSFVPGLVWHVTHRCHKKEFLLKFRRDKMLWIRLDARGQAPLRADHSELHDHVQPHPPDRDRDGRPRGSRRPSRPISLASPARPLPRGADCTTCAKTGAARSGRTASMPRPSRPARSSRDA
ncbi:MAG: hypothetical protein MZU84_08145 [Sphingobacterium sp.]|nr:hypothetical protein [Sphingobacterium sp.]